MTLDLPTLLADPDAAAFEPHAGAAFTLWAGAAPVPLVLDAVARGGAHGDSARSFTLAFHTPGGEHLEQATYPVEHADAGRFVLFLVPVGRDARGVAYEAVFNRDDR